jgi:hypothetical protein
MKQDGEPSLTPRSANQNALLGEALAAVDSSSTGRKDARRSNLRCRHSSRATPPHFRVPRSLIRPVGQSAIKGSVAAVTPANSQADNRYSLQSKSHPAIDLRRACNGSDPGPRHPLVAQLMAFRRHGLGEAFPSALNADISRIAYCSPARGTSSPSPPRRNPNGIFPPR